MDFSTMGKKVDNGEYKDVDAFKVRYCLQSLTPVNIERAQKDFVLICDNCQHFNPNDSEFYKAAVKLKHYGNPLINRSFAAVLGPGEKQDEASARMQERLLEEIENECKIR